MGIGWETSKGWVPAHRSFGSHIFSVIIPNTSMWKQRSIMAVVVNWEQCCFLGDIWQYAICGNTFLVVTTNGRGALNILQCTGQPLIANGHPSPNLVVLSCKNLDYGNSMWPSGPEWLLTRNVALSKLFKMSFSFLICRMNVMMPVLPIILNTKE